VLAEKPDPETATTVPGGPRTGATVMVGVPLCGVTAVGGVGCERAGGTHGNPPLFGVLPSSRGVGAEKIRTVCRQNGNVSLHNTILEFFFCFTTLYVVKQNLD
jgi:hypothetical protein